MKVWFTSDYHLGHANIIKYCKRPFKDIEQMNKTIIRNHNQRVKPDDMVFFLGDFCFRNTAGGKEGEGNLERAKHYIKQLNGNIIFIKGNHDKNNTLKTYMKSAVIEIGGNGIFLVHNPKDLDKRYPINFVGHIHGEWKFKRADEGIDLINVGVDVWKFLPISFEEIQKAYQKWKKEAKK